MPRFATGRLVATPGAIAHLAKHGAHPLNLVLRHVRGDPGDLEQADVAANARAIIDGSRILSAFTVFGERFYVITEADRSSTCVLLCSEY